MRTIKIPSKFTPKLPHHTGSFHTSLQISTHPPNSRSYFHHRGEGTNAPNFRATETKQVHHRVASVNSLPLLLGVIK